MPIHARLISIGRVLVLGSLPLVASCDREILPLDPTLQIQGYEVRGTVWDRFGNPVPGVEVRIDYLLEYVDDGPEPQRTYEVQSPGEAITVGVRNRNNQFVYTYSPGVVQPGPFTFSWDKTTSSGAQAPPGVYHVVYTAGPGVRLTFPVLISGVRAAVTDSLGRYTVPDLALPVDFYPVPDYSTDGSAYYGNFRVTSEVVLGFLIDGIEVYRTVQLIRNQVVAFDARLN